MIFILGVCTNVSPQMALEEYIKQVKEIWTNYTLDLVNYQNKCRLIRYVESQTLIYTCCL